MYRSSPDSFWPDGTYYGSYGLSLWAQSTKLGAGAAEDSLWGTCDVKAAANVPLLFDCTAAIAHPDDSDEPPEYEGHVPDLQMSRVCINRHAGGINMLFMDWSVRRVGLKELWTLKWHPSFETAGPWTKAGGARPENWPQWLRQFKDY